MKLFCICDNYIGDGEYCKVFDIEINSIILETISKNVSIIHGFTCNVDTFIILESVDKYQYFITFVTFINMSSILLVYT